MQDKSIEKDTLLLSERKKLENEFINDVGSYDSLFLMLEGVDSKKLTKGTLDSPLFKHSAGVITDLGNEFSKDLVKFIIDPSKIANQSAAYIGSLKNVHEKLLQGSDEDTKQHIKDIIAKRNAPTEQVKSQPTSITPQKPPPENANSEKQSRSALLAEKPRNIHYNRANSTKSLQTIELSIKKSAILAKFRKNLIDTLSDAENNNKSDKEIDKIIMDAVEKFKQENNKDYKTLQSTHGTFTAATHWTGLVKTGAEKALEKIIEDVRGKPKEHVFLEKARALKNTFKESINKLLEPEKKNEANSDKSETPRTPQC